MTRLRSAGAFAPALLALAACHAIHPGRDVPAVIVNPAAESRAALAQSVAAALNHAPVTLADDALTREATLVVEPARPRDANGVPLQGRELRVPEHFRLVKRGAACVLIHERTGKRFTLERTQCAPQ